MQDEVPLQSAKIPADLPPLTRVSDTAGSVVELLRLDPGSADEILESQYDVRGFQRNGRHAAKDTLLFKKFRRMRAESGPKGSTTKRTLV